MWPYDYFNQFSSLENEFLNDRLRNRPKEHRKIFVAMWFGHKKTWFGGKNYIKSQQDVQVKLKQIIESKGFSASNSEEGRPREDLKWRFEVNRSDGDQVGNIDLAILSKILCSTFVICDITPENGSKKTNPNVMFELGIASAWKMPEQVIVVSRGKPEDAPSNVNKNFVIQVDLNWNVVGKDISIADVIQDRIKKLVYMKSILLKNAISQLDRKSLGVLSRRNGLMFAESSTDEETMRHLLALGIVYTDVFPSGKSLGYRISEFGKVVLKKIGVPLYSDIFIDMHDFRWWKCDKSKFLEKKKLFEVLYGLKYDNCLASFVESIPFEIKKDIEFIRGKELEKEGISWSKREQEEINFSYLDYYTDKYPLEFIKEKSLNVWEEVCRKIIEGRE